MTYDENKIDSGVDVVRIFFYDLLRKMNFSNEEDYAAFIELSLNEIENLPSIDELKNI